MNRGIWADPKSDRGHLAEPVPETDETLSPARSHLASEHPQAPNESVRAGTVSYSALQSFGQPEHQVQANATHGSDQTGYAEQKAPVAVPTSNPTPWPNQGQLAYLRDAGLTHDLPGAAREGSFLIPDNLHLSRATPEARKQRQNEPDVQLIAKDDQQARHIPDIVEKVADLLRHSLAINTERAYESDLRPQRTPSAPISAMTLVACPWPPSSAALPHCLKPMRRQD